MTFDSQNFFSSNLASWKTIEPLEYTENAKISQSVEREKIYRPVLVEPVNVDTENKNNVVFLPKLNPNSPQRGFSPR